MVRFKKVLLLAVLVSFSLLGCGQEETQYIELDKRPSRAPATEKAAKGEKPIVLALGAMTTPKQAYGYYQDMVKYLEKKLGRSIHMLDRDSYAEVNTLLKDGRIDVAFVCGRPYVDGHDEFGLELLVAPQIQGKVKYHSYIIVHKDSNINKFDELEGKVFAFADPLSNSGRLVPTYMLVKELGKTPEAFFKKYIYSGSHDNSISMVAARIVDGAGVDSLIWDHLHEFNPIDTAKTKIIQVSPPFGIPPVTVKPQLDNQLKATLKQLFLNIHQDAKGRLILQKMRIEKFVDVADSNYDDIREAKRWLEEHNITW